MWFDKTKVIVTIILFAFATYMGLQWLTPEGDRTMTISSFNLKQVSGPDDLRSYERQANQYPGVPPLDDPSSWDNVSIAIRHYGGGGPTIIEQLGDLFEGQNNTTDYHTSSMDRDDVAEVMGSHMANETSGIRSGQSSRARSSPSPSASVSFEQGASRGKTVNRHSSTNVQVEGIDEPDIVKTDGRTLLYASGQTRAIRAFPPERMRVRQTRPRAGPMLRSGENFVQLLNRGLIGLILHSGRLEHYWTLDFTPRIDRSNIEAARMVGDKLYVVLKIKRDGEDCPFDYGMASLDCEDILRPDVPVTPDALFVMLKINASNGRLLKKQGVLGRSEGTATYVSNNRLYLGYTLVESTDVVLMNFALNHPEMMPSSLLRRIRTKQYHQTNYEAARATSQRIEAVIGRSAKRRKAFRSYVRSMDDQLIRTGLAAFDLKTLTYQGGRTLPGHLLNQFSMDEHNGHLRVATTIEDLVGQKSSSRVYVLNQELDIKGVESGLGPGQRIYAVRFVGERGYVVTYRQTDPFYILDLSDPSDPRETGELKMPGFSSYLHPISNDRVIGIGKGPVDGWRQGVKAVLFDVSNNQNPRILSKLKFDAPKSAIDKTHHAFLNDPRHRAFFLPAGEKGYMISYDDNQLRVVAQSSGQPDIERAIYINNYLYMIGPSRIVVWSEEDWTRVRTFSLGDERGAVSSAGTDSNNPARTGAGGDE